MFDFTQVKEVKLSKGAHDSPEKGMCFMEMAAWFAGEEHSDKPACVSPSLGYLGIMLNDRMADEPRDRLLKPMIPHVVGTADEKAEEKRAEYICLRAFQYGFGIIHPDFVHQYEAARNMREARDMLHEGMRRLSPRTHRGHYDDYSMSMKYGLEASYGANQFAGNMARCLDDMLMHQLPMPAYFEAAVAEPASPIKNVTFSYPNLENVKRAGRVFSEMHLVVPDWSIALDTLREAIRLGRHDGFTLATNLEARHVALRELVDA